VNSSIEWLVRLVDGMLETRNAYRIFVGKLLKRDEIEEHE
jgi:hypothetical protein